MGEVPLARLWNLPDGTSCLLVKDSRADNWQARVVRGSETLRTEVFGSPIVAMDEAKKWRAMYDHAVQAAR
jgi:hypothetical protein